MIQAEPFQLPVATPPCNTSKSSEPPLGIVPVAPNEAPLIVTVASAHGGGGVQVNINPSAAGM